MRQIRRIIDDSFDIQKPEIRFAGLEIRTGSLRSFAKALSAQGGRIGVNDHRCFVRCNVGPVSNVATCALPQCPARSG